MCVPRSEARQKLIKSEIAKKQTCWLLTVRARHDSANLFGKHIYKHTHTPE